MVGGSCDARRDSVERGRSLSSGHSTCSSSPRVPRSSVYSSACVYSSKAPLLSTGSAGSSSFKPSPSTRLRRSHDSLLLSFLPRKTCFPIAALPSPELRMAWEWMSKRRAEIGCHRLSLAASLYTDEGVELPHYLTTCTPSTIASCSAQRTERQRLKDVRIHVHRQFDRLQRDSVSSLPTRRLQRTSSPWRQFPTRYQSPTPSPSSPDAARANRTATCRSEEHTSELQSQ